MRLADPALILTPAAFEARFSDLAELICDAAQEGYAKPFMEAQYTLLQSWMREHFPLCPFPSWLSLEFERLFAPSTLSALLAQDNGSLITRLLETQDAIAAWKNALGESGNP